jgi:hypothetical protein
MAYSISSLSTYAYSRIAKDAPERLSGLSLKVLEDNISAALQRLADKIAQSGKLSTTLRLNYAVTLASGEKTLTGNDNNSVSMNSLLIETVGGVPEQYVTISTGTSYPLEYLPYRQDLDNPPNMLDFRFFAISSARVLRVVDNTGTAVTGTPVVTFSGNYIPTLANLPTQLEDNLLDCLIEVTLEQPTPPATT